MSFLKLPLQHAEQLKAILGRMPHEYSQILDLGLNILNGLEKVEDAVESPPKNDAPA